MRLRRQHFRRTSDLAKYHCNFGIFCLCLLQDGNVGVGVFPEGEEALIRCLRFDGLTLYGQGLTELEACDCANLLVLDNSAMVEDFLEL